MYSWQNIQWTKVMQRKNSLPHAILLRGRSGIGKFDFAINLSNALLCKEPDHLQMACGHCSSCLWLKEGAHPDFKLITSEDDYEFEGNIKKNSTKRIIITIAQIRQLYDYLSLSTHQVAGFRVIVISPAEALNLAAANALLKMLEEPPSNTIFLLVSSQPQQLLPTIISRCQVIDMPIPSKINAIEWLNAQGVNQPEVALQYAGGAPLDALRLQDQISSNDKVIKQLSLGGKLDPFNAAQLFLSLGMSRAINVIQKWTFDLVSFKLVHKLHYHTEYERALQELSKSVNLSGLLLFERQLNEAKKAANHPLSNEMQLENILLQYTHVFNT